MHKRVLPIATPSNLAGRLIPLLTLLAAAPVAVSIAQAGVINPITYTWTGQGASSNFNDTGNWENSTPPPSTPWANNVDISDGILKFGDTKRHTITDSDLYANQLVFDAITAPYYLAGYDFTNHIGSGGIIYNPAGDIRTEIQGPVQLHASQTWEINSGSVAIRSGISDSDDGPSFNYQIEKTGAGDLALESSSDNTWGGGLKLTAGRVIFVYDPYSSQSFIGTGAITFNGGTLRSRADYYYMGGGGADDINLSNDIISNGLVSIENDAPLHITFESTGNNLFRMDTDTTLAITGAPLHIERDITESGGSRNLTLQSNTAVILYGDSGWTGDTDIVAGALIFSGTDNTPGKLGGITISSHGYAGIGAANSIATFLSKINQANSLGTIGFDSDPDSSINTFTDPIDLTGFGSDIRLGSATSAIIGSLQDSNSLITPQGTDYRFGGGGGLLQVATPLTYQTTANGTVNDLVVDSPAESPLTVLILNPNNTISGSVIVNDSALIFGDGVPLPGTTENFVMNSGGYIGTLHNPSGGGNEIPIADYLAHFANDTLGIIGFDNSRTAITTRDVDLTGVTMPVSSNPVYLGTASALVDEIGEISGPGVRFTGTINAPADGVHRFAAFKAGALEVSGTLTGNSAIIGSPDSLGTFGDVKKEEHSVVALTGNNDGHLANGVIFYGGHLKVGQDPVYDGTIGTDPTHALGDGTLSVMPVNFTINDSGYDEQPRPLLSVAENGIIINNPIHLGTDLSVGDDHDFTLGGPISGSGALYVGDDSYYGVNLTLRGNNTFTGDLNIMNGGSLDLFHDHATGAGVLRFRNSSETGGYVNFNTSNPVIHGLEGYASYDSLILNSTGPTTLTIDQSIDTQFSGNFYGDESAGSTLIKQGVGTLRYQGDIDTIGINDGQGNNISLDIRGGTFIVGSDTYLTPGTTIKLSGGTFGTEEGVSVSNPIIVSSGRLAGSGSYSSSVSIGAGAMLSPGLPGYGGTGTLSFNHLELNSGGIYEFSVKDPDSTNPLGQDRINVNGVTTLVINSTSQDPFVIKVISLDPSGDPGTLEGIDFQHGLYSWTLINYAALSVPGNGGLFDPTLFSLDLTGFTSDALNGGDFNIFQSGNNLMLGFTPVPEPSTYAMMALGLGIVAWTLRRRRRA